jgi:hypothetical protein
MLKYTQIGEIMLKYTRDCAIDPLTLLRLVMVILEYPIIFTIRG